MEISNFISLFSGIALFLFGMSLMGDGLKRVAGNRLEGLLYKLTNTRLKGILLGTGVTAVIQSSAATSVMVVGFVNSGMMRFRQAIGIVLGSILGTSVTGWILCLSDLSGGSGWVSLLSTATISGIVSIAGILIRMFAKRATHRHIGDILLGFSILMFGMSTMSSAVSPLKEVPEFVSLLTSFSNPILGILAGAAFTAILQSASASIGILQALAITGSISFATALPLVIGIAIGAAFPVLMAAAGANIDGKRTALIYLIIVLCGGGLFGTAFYIANAAVHFPFMGVVMNTVSIAALNSVFRLATVLLLAPLIPPLEALTCAILKEPPAAEDAEDQGPVLEERFIAFPALALEQCQDRIDKMAEYSRESVLSAMGLLRRYDPRTLEHVVKLEGRVDRYEDALGTYILRVSKGELNTQQNRTFTKFLHTITDWERISDYALNIAYAVRQMAEKDVLFSGRAMEEMRTLEAALTENLDRATKAFVSGDLEAAETVEPLNEVIENLCETMKDRHVERMKAGECTMTQGVAFNDLLIYLERISGHCSNIALATIEVEQNSFRAHTHSYHTEKFKQENFSRLYEEDSRRFSLAV